VRNHVFIDFVVNLCNESPLWLVAMETQIPKSTSIFDVQKLTKTEKEKTISILH